MTSQWTETDCLVRGAAIHVTRLGDAHRPAVVLAHGFSDSGPCWLPLASDLAADYAVVLPDARGHGHSARVQPGESLDMAADLAGVIETLGLKDPVVGGHSMGASISAQMVGRFPTLARALILEDPAWLDNPFPASPAENPFHDWLKSLVGKSQAEVEAFCHAENPTWGKDQWGPWATSKQQFDMNFFTAANTMGEDWRAVAQAIPCPTLLITADVDKGSIVSAEIAAEATRLNPRVQVTHVAGAGHNIRREQYPAFLAAVRSFLQGLPAS